MGNRRLELNRRKIGKEKPKNTCLIVAEGQNKTELIYFDNFNARDSLYNLRLESASATDPKNMVRRTKIFIKKYDIRQNDGDLVFCLMDTDDNQDKKHQINDAIKTCKTQKIVSILSSPCFEIWFLNHFEFSTSPFNNQALLSRLKEHGKLPNYSKSKNVFPLLKDKMQQAKTNSSLQKKYHRDLGMSLDEFGPNPFTDVDVIIDFIEKKTQ